MTDAPFVIRPPNAHNLRSGTANTHTHGHTASKSRHEYRKSLQPSSSFGTVFGEGKIDGTLYWNHDGVYSGLVCGSSVRPFYISWALRSLLFVVVVKRVLTLGPSVVFVPVCTEQGSCHDRYANGAATPQ
jgi:hypothetical protein